MGCILPLNTYYNVYYSRVLCPLTLEFSNASAISFYNKKSTFKRACGLNTFSCILNPSQRCNFPVTSHSKSCLYNGPWKMAARKMNLRGLYKEYVYKMLMKQVLKGSLITHFADSVNLLGAESTNYENHISIWKTTPETELVTSKMAPKQKASLHFPLPTLHLERVCVVQEYCSPHTHFWLEIEWV